MWVHTFMHTPDASTYSRPMRSSQTTYQSLTRREISQTIIDNTSLCLSPSFKYMFIYVYVLHSSRRHTSTIGLTKTESLVFNSTVLILQSLPQNTLVMIAIGLWESFCCQPILNPQREHFVAHLIIFVEGVMLLGIP